MNSSQSTPFRRPTPRRLPWIVAAACAVACAGACAEAAAGKRAVRGPMQDLKVAFPLDYLHLGCPPVDYPTYTLPYPPHTNTWPNISDHEWITCNPLTVFDTAARAVGYVSSSDGDFTKGNLGLVTIFGLDLDPHNPDPQITGVDPVQPEFDVRDERWVGISKTEYGSTRQVVPVSQLASLLGPEFDLSPFAHANPDSLVYVFTGTMPAKNMGMRTSGSLYAENFSQTWHVGHAEGGSFGPGTLAGTNLTVTRGSVDVLGLLNQGSRPCAGNPGGNCLSLWGQGEPGAVNTIPVFDLQPTLTYQIDFTAWSQGASGYANLAVALGDGRVQPDHAG